MTTLAFDDTGARYYETGVSKGILFPIDGSTGVPWNGLVSVNIDPQGGEAESYWYDGIKYMNRVLAEDFQATVQAISTPPEFRACEGDREYAAGVMTSFNKRDKFHMAWRTEIGSDQGESIGYKIHIAYNNLVQPSGREYQTIADTVTMAARSFTVTATPACGRHSYFWFDSRYFDLSDLEAQLYAGNLPVCSALSGFVTPVGGGDGVPVDPDAGCAYVLEDFESYVHGQVLDQTRVLRNTNILYTTDATLEGGEWLTGLINNGLDIIELPAEGAFAANDSAASEVGTDPVLVDDDDASYFTSAQGDLGYTVGLPPLVGYIEGCAFELHIRASISGGVNPDDPDNLDADMQVHIATDDTGDITVGGFSDGTDEGMGFALSVVDGTPVDYVIPLSMDAWVDSTIADVVTALQAGAFLNIVGATNNNPDTTPVVRVYEAKVVMLNDTEFGKFLRPESVDDEGKVTLRVYGPSNTLVKNASNKISVDFKVSQVPDDAAAAGFVANLLGYTYEFTDVDETVWENPGLFNMVIESDTPALRMFLGTWATDDDWVEHSYLDPDKWYTATLDWRWDSIQGTLFERDNPSEVWMDTTVSLTDRVPKATLSAIASFLGS